MAPFQKISFFAVLAQYAAVNFRDIAERENRAIDPTGTKINSVVEGASR